MIRADFLGFNIEMSWLILLRTLLTLHYHSFILHTLRSLFNDKYGQMKMVIDCRMRSSLDKMTSYLSS
jgi:hypothetical protein